MKAIFYTAAFLVLTSCAVPEREMSEPLTRLPSDSAQHLAIASGTTSLIVEGRLDADETAEVVLGEFKGNILMAHALGSEQDLTVSVHRMDSGEALPDNDGVDAFWSGTLPATVGYLIEVAGASEPTDYALEIEVPRAVHFDAQAATLTAEALPEAPLAYVLSGSAEQNLEAELSAGEGPHLTVHGLDDGHALLASSADAQTFDGALPSTQHYIIRVHPDAKAGAFTLSIRLE